MHENSRFHFLNGTKKLSVFLLSQQNNPRRHRNDNNDQPDKAADSQECGTDMAQSTLMALSCPFRLYGLHRCVFRLLHIICLCHTALRLLYAVCLCRTALRLLYAVCGVSAGCGVPLSASPGLSLSDSPLAWDILSVHLCQLLFSLNTS